MKNLRLEKCRRELCLELDPGKVHYLIRALESEIEGRSPSSDTYGAIKSILEMIEEKLS